MVAAAVSPDFEPLEETRVSLLPHLTSEQAVTVIERVAKILVQDTVRYRRALERGAISPMLEAQIRQEASEALMVLGDDVVTVTEIIAEACRS